MKKYVLMSGLLLFSIIFPSCVLNSLRESKFSQIKNPNIFVDKMPLLSHMFKEENRDAAAFLIKNGASLNAYYIPDYIMSGHGQLKGSEQEEEFYKKLSPKEQLKQCSQEFKEFIKNLLN